MKLGANTVLFGGYDMETAFKYLAMAGYDGVEISAIEGMSEHLVLSRWREIVPDLKRLSKEYGLELLAMEQPKQDPETMEGAMQAAAEAGHPHHQLWPRRKNGRRSELAEVYRIAWRAGGDGGALRRHALRQGARGAERLQHPHDSESDGGDKLTRLWQSTWTRRTFTARTRIRSRR